MTVAAAVTALLLPAQEKRRARVTVVPESESASPSELARGAAPILHE
jgi:hypothetical protein